jgi:hypothetical protein
MRPLALFTYIGALVLSSCASHEVPPAPAHPVIEGNWESVSHTDIQAAIALVQSEFAQYSRPRFPIYRVKVTDRNHIDVCYRPPGIIEECQPVERIKGQWKTTQRVIVTGQNIPTG